MYIIHSLASVHGLAPVLAENLFLKSDPRFYLSSHPTYLLYTPALVILLHNMTICTFNNQTTRAPLVVADLDGANKRYSVTVDLLIFVFVCFSVCLQCCRSAR